MLRSLRDSYRDAFAGLPRPVWLLATVSFVNRSGTMVLPFLALYLSDRRGFTVTEAGRILSLYGIGAMAGAALGGWLSDAIGPRRVLLGSLTLTAAGFLWLGSIDSRSGIAAMVFALSIAGEAFRPAMASALAESAVPGEATRALALNRLAVNLGMTFGPAAGGFLAVRDYIWLFVGDAITCLAAAGVLMATLPPLHALHPPVRARDAAPARAPWRDGPMVALALLAMSFAIVIFQIFTTYPLFLHAVLGFAESSIGLVLAINTVLIVVLQMPVLRAIRGIPPLAVAGPGAFLFCLGLALTPLAGGSFALVAATVVVWTAGEMLSLPLIEGVVADRAAAGRRGRYMGMFTLSFSAAFILAPLAGTWIYDTIGPRAVWLACGLAGLGLWAGLATLSRRVETEKAARPG